MSVLKNDNFLRALMRQPVDRQPIWLMRQAGRYLPEYRATRAKAGDFLTLCKTPELACEVTLQPLERFDLDAAILFSDILTIPDSMGMGLHFVENEGPRFSKTLQTENDIQQLPIPDPNIELRYVSDAVKLIQRELHQRVPLIGFAGSPWTVACYMLEGGSSGKQFERIRKMVYQQPHIVHVLLEKLTQATILYLNAQIESGVNAVMLFDTWGGLLTTSHYEEFSLHYMQKIIQVIQNFTTVHVAEGRPNHGWYGSRAHGCAFPRNTNCSEIHTSPIIIFTKNGGQWLEKIAQSGCDAVGIDWTMDLANAAKIARNKVALQGNLDPLALFAPEEILEKEIRRIMQAMQNHPGFIFNLGHGILPETPPERVKFLIDTVHGYKR